MLSLLLRLSIHLTDLIWRHRRPGTQQTPLSKTTNYRATKARKESARRDRVEKASGAWPTWATCDRLTTRVNELELQARLLAAVFSAESAMIQQLVELAQALQRVGVERVQLLGGRPVWWTLSWRSGLLFQFCKSEGWKIKFFEIELLKTKSKFLGKNHV